MAGSSSISGTNYWRRAVIWGAAAALLLVASTGLPASAEAPRGGFRHEVDSTLDAVDANPGDGICASEAGECTLRAAIMEANAAQLKDTVYIYLQQGQEYRLEIPGTGEDDAATGDLDIRVPIVIETGLEGLIGGADRGGFSDFAVVDGNGLDRPFDVNAAGQAGFAYLTIEGGAAIAGEHGGGVRIASPTEFSLVDVRDNDAETGLGGGIYVEAGGTLQVFASEFYENEAFAGGALYVAPGGIADIEQSRLSDNSVTANGGAINNGGTLELTNVTISHNLADLSGGGIYNVSSNLTVLFATIAYNTAAAGSNVFTEVGGTTSITASIIAYGVTGTNCAGGGTIANGGYNIESANTCGFNGAATDEVNVDPQLAALDDYGGFTLTHLIRPTSPAIDQVASGVCDTVGQDQRGFDRPAPDAAVNCDSGAYEAGTAFFRVTTTADGADSNPGDGFCQVSGECTLRAAIQEANALPGEDRVLLTGPGPYRLGLIGTGENLAATGDLDITDHMRIQGELPFPYNIFLGGRDDLSRAIEDRGPIDLTPTTVIEVNGIDRGIEIVGAVEVSIVALKITEGLGPVGEAGGAISNPGGDLTLYFSELYDNEATYGGGLYSGGGTVVAYSQIRDNRADFGGGWYNASSGALMFLSAVAGNEAAGGGGIWNTNQLEVTDSLIHGNRAGNGGGVYNTGMVLATRGGGVFTGGSFEATNVTISGNTATGTGGGLFNNAGGIGALAALNNTTIVYNEAEAVATSRGGINGGGGVANVAGDVINPSNTIIAENTSPTAPDCIGPIDSKGFNLVGDLTGCTWNTAGGDITNQEAQLGELVYLGDPFDFLGVYALMADSPALDGGNPAIPGSGPYTCENSSFDSSRPVGEACDIGAYEMGQADLEVEIFAQPEPVQQGQELSVTVDVRNLSKSTDADEVGLTITFDAEVEIVDAFKCDVEGQTVYCEFPVFYQGVRGTLVVLRPLVAGSLTTTATAEILEDPLVLDPNLKNNSDEHESTVTQATPTATSTASATATSTPSSTPTSEPTPTGTASVTPSATPSTTPGPTQELFEGWNLIAEWLGAALDGADEIIEYLNGNVEPPVWESIARYDTDEDEWDQTFKNAPLPSFNTLQAVEQGEEYWLFVASDAVLTPVK
jgi:CSLREA domain-containing protein